MLDAMLPPHHFLQTAAIHHAPVVREIIARLGILDVINQLLPKQDSQIVSDAQCALALLLNLFSDTGRVALYRVEDWLSTHDAQLLLGEDVLAHDFNDDRLALFLDHVYAVGTDTLLGRVVHAWTNNPHCPASDCAHLDTTSFLLYGAYDREITAEMPCPARGHSKDHRPDLHQLVFGLTLQGETGMPLAATIFDGNTADPVAFRVLAEDLEERVANPDALTLVGDCKLVDAITLGEILDNGFHFISLLPDTFALRETLIERACASEAPLPLLVQRPGRTKDAPARLWPAFRSPQ